VASLAEYISRQSRRNWREALILHLPWTEYTLYFTFAEAKGMFERLHLAGGTDSVLRFRDSLWFPPDRYLREQSLATWRLRPLERPPEGVAVVVQSWLGHSGREVRHALDRVLRTLPGLLVLLARKLSGNQLDLTAEWGNTLGVRLLSLADLL